MAGASEANVDRRERLRKLALETIDLAKVILPPVCVRYPSMKFTSLPGPLHPPQPSWLSGMQTLPYTPHK